ncbi:MAG: hypothetical protein JWM16_1812 [Verrucomicrobiales bacterium]|nr:hypothetical protein [Verrucomicrobiales bacterium]
MSPEDPDYIAYDADTIPPKYSQTQQAFNRLELCIVLAGLTLLAGVAVPAVTNKARMDQAGCVSNLRQVGRAFQIWANDHDDAFPSLVSVSEGGTRVVPPGGTSAWVQFTAISNELGNPKILACPSDTKRPATEFSADPHRGLFHANFRNSAISYFLGHPLPQTPGDLLAGDRNLRLSQNLVTCSAFGNSPGSINFRDFPGLDPSIKWTNGLHNVIGNFLYVDGRVEQLANNDLPLVLRKLEDSFAIHLLMP